MALTVVPEEKSTGQVFANQLATGLGSSLGQVAGKGIGAGLGALGTGFGQMTGLAEKPKQLTEEMLIKAGFTPEDAKLITNSPPALQAKLIDAISQREPAEQQVPQGEQPQEMPEEEMSFGQEAAKAHPNAQRIFDEIDKESQGKSIDDRPSALFRPKKETPEEKRLKLAQEKLTVAENAPKRKEINEEVKTWRKASKKADKDIEALESLATIPQKDFSPSFLRRAMTKAGFGDFFLTAPEETYKKIVEGLVIDKARDIASAGKITAALLDRVRVRYPALENTAEGRRILANILNREAEEEKIYSKVYNELRKELRFEPGKEPLDIIERVEERASSELKAFKERANQELEKDLGMKSAPEGKRIIKNDQTGERGYIDDNGKLVTL